MACLIVNDEDYEKISKMYEGIGGYFEDIIQSYLDVLGNVCKDGVTGGNLYVNLLEFKSTASELSGQIEATLGIAKSICTDFVSDIDEADKALY